MMLQIHNNQTEMLVLIALRGGDIDDREAEASIVYGYDGVARRRSSPLRGARIRSMRMEEAKKKGTHTKQEWETLRSLFDCCVGCGTPYDSLIGGAPTKDHIIPIFVGGCDCIANLQPMCRECNSSKSDTFDRRALVNPNWPAEYVAARTRAVEDERAAALEFLRSCL